MMASILGINEVTCHRPTKSLRLLGKVSLLTQAPSCDLHSPLLHQRNGLQVATWIAGSLEICFRESWTPCRAQLVLIPKSGFPSQGCVQGKIAKQVKLSSLQIR